VICAECKRQIANASQSCPLCGAPVSVPARAQARARAMTDSQRTQAPVPPGQFGAEPPSALPDDGFGWFPPSPIAGQQPPLKIPPGPAARTGVSMRRAVALYGVAVAVLATVIAVIGLLAHSSSARHSTNEGRQLTESQLQPGDCLVGSNLALGTGNPWPYRVTAVRCTQPHAAEVFFSGNAWPESTATYPGDKKVNTAAENRCNTAFMSYVEIYDPQVSVFAYDFVAPDSSSWASGDREVVCVAYESGVSVPYSIKGTHR
jgi:hypothetical protein